MANNTREKSKQDQKAQIVLSVVDFRALFSELMQEHTKDLLKEIQTLKDEVKNLNKKLAETDTFARETKKLPKERKIISRTDGNALNGNIVQQKIENYEKIENETHKNMLTKGKKENEKFTKYIYGSNTSSSDEFTGRERKLWLYIGRCKTGTAELHVKKYLEKKCPGKQFEVFALPSKGTNVSFRIGADISLKDQLYDPQFWPENILVKKYIFFRKTANFTEK